MELTGTNLPSAVSFDQQAQVGLGWLRGCGRGLRSGGRGSKGGKFPEESVVDTGAVVLLEGEEILEQAPGLSGAMSLPSRDAAWMERTA